MVQTNFLLINFVFLTAAAVQLSSAFSPSSYLEWKPKAVQSKNLARITAGAALSFQESARSRSRSLTLQMGFFDGISKAFSNQEYTSQDQRVRASHILIKGDDVGVVLGKIKQLMGELNERVQQEEGVGGNENVLQPVFSEIARRESQCPSGAQGGDLGLFGPGKMVKEFDDALFPADENVPPPPVGSILGPVVTDFGCHVILVTQREQSRDQVEEKLARND